MNNSETEVDSGICTSNHPCPVALVTAANVHEDTQCLLPQDLSPTPTESIHDGTQGDNNKKECNVDLELKKKRRGRPPVSPNQKQFLKLKLSHCSFKKGRQYLSLPFMRANGMNKLEVLTLVGKDGVKWKVNLKGEKSGTAMCLGKGWKEFAEANGLKTGEYFTLESVWKNEIPMLSLVNTVSTSDRNQKAVTLVLEIKDVKACTLHLPSEFVTAIGIKKLGKITLLGKDGMKWWGHLLSRNGTVAVGIGWVHFCEANGVKLGESFSLVFINDEEDTGPIFKFCPNTGN